MVLQPGDPAPQFVARASNSDRFVFDSAAGRYLVLSFVEGDPAHIAVTRALSASPLFDDHHAALFIVTGEAGHEAPGALPLRIPGVRAFFDDDGALARLYSLADVQGRPVSFILSHRLQVLATFAGDTEGHAQKILAVLGSLPRIDRLPPGLGHAPVLIIPGVFEPELCRHLIEGYNSDGGLESGFMRDIDGKTLEVRDSSHKVRRDWHVPEENERLRAILQNRIHRRIVPQIRKAFQFEATRMERYVVSCYDAADGGHFRPHRDNTTKGTAHRRFAVSINLNAGEYDGGDLRFPEFGQATYRPPTGGCCVFSCSLLHEATPVSRGRRFAFLPFLYDEASRAIRDENLRFLAASGPS